MDGGNKPPNVTVDKCAVKALFKKRHMRFLSKFEDTPGLRMRFFLTLELTEAEKTELGFAVREADNLEKPHDRYISDVCWVSKLCVRVTIRKQTFMQAHRDMPKIVGTAINTLIDKRHLPAK